MVSMIISTVELLIVRTPEAMTWRNAEAERGRSAAVLVDLVDLVLFRTNDDRSSRRYWMRVSLSGRKALFPMS